jgi:hypothetical protein
MCAFVLSPYNVEADCPDNSDKEYRIFTFVEQYRYDTDNCCAISPLCVATAHKEAVY